MLRAAGLRLRAVTPRCRLRCQLWDKRATALEQRGVPARPAGSRPVEAAVPSSETWICEALLCEGRAGAPTSGRRRGNESGSVHAGAGPGASSPRRVAVVHGGTSWRDARGRAVGGADAVWCQAWL